MVGTIQCYVNIQTIDHGIIIKYRLELNDHVNSYQLCYQQLLCY